ncbi:MAG: class I SAM-dependent methyltransferase, partial [Sedimentisphaerales bacterium]|nr:class I SAM-dependent methyltransferase [Sedimentisphaerales bacterium]
RAIETLRSHESAKVRAIGQALRQTREQRVCEQEQEIISRIEQRRSGLLDSREHLSIIDFGAGGPDSRRTNEQMRAGVRGSAPVSAICQASMPAFWALLLFRLIRRLEPVSCLELGTCVGISAAYQAAALALNGKGRLLNLEGSPQIARIAAETLTGLGLENASVNTGPFHETYRPALAACKPADFLFIDGHHDHDATLRYFREAIGFLAEEALLVFDDISWSPGMRSAWTEIAGDERVAVAIDLQKMGMVFLSKPISNRTSLRIPLQV